MNRTRIATLVTTAALGTALVAGAATASARQATTTHTLTLRSHQISSTQVGNNGSLQADRDLRNGHTIGYDAISCHFDFKTSRAHCRVAVALANGTLAGRFTLRADNNTAQGEIVNGTGAYAGVTGTISARPVKHSNDSVVTLQYHR
jgi:hypothetical protein